MATITETARSFFDACERGQGWEGCRPFCHESATFSAQAEPLADVHTLRDYTEWMKGITSVLPDSSYVVKAFATDAERNSVSGFGVFSGTHTGEGGPVPPTGKRATADYVYVMEFDGPKIKHMTKIWNAGWSLRELGWTG